jgi:hypothetical protein
MPRRPPGFPVYRERSALQSLVGKEWLPAANLYPAGPSTIVNMLTKGWLKRKPDKMFGWTYCITSGGEAALRAQIPSKRARSSLQKRGRPKGRGSKAKK